MPIYEFACECGHITEKLIRTSNKEIDWEFQKCEVCGELAPRIISQGSFKLKGKWFKSSGEY